MAKLSTKYNKDKSGKKTLKGWQITLDNGKTVFLGKKAYTEPAAVDCRDALTLIERDLNGGGQWGAGRFSDHTEKRLERLREDRPKLFALLQEKGFIHGPASITIGELYREFRKAAIAEGRKPKTLENNENGVNRLFRFFPRETPADAIDTKDAQAFVNWLLTEAEVKGRDVDFNEGFITVRSPKMERSGKGERLTPLFPELREELEAWRREADEQGLTADEDARVIARYTSSANVGTPLKKIVAKAGLQPWPRLLQNLRASAATDILQEHGAKNESEWVGHSEEVSLQHYQRTTPEAIKAAQTKPFFR